MLIFFFKKGCTNPLKLSLALDDSKLKITSRDEGLPASTRLLLSESKPLHLKEGKRVVVSIHSGDLDSAADLTDQDHTNQTLIGSISINTRTNWDVLDAMVKNLYGDYLQRLDEDSSESGGLGLGLDSIASYYVGDMPRPAEPNTSDKLPDLLPYGYLVADHTSVVLKLRDAAESSIDALCYETLVPKNVMQRYVSLL